MLKNVLAFALMLGLSVAYADDPKPATPPTAPKAQATPATPAPGAATTATIGKPAPEFTLTDLDGKQHTLSQYKGKIVVLEWTNHECPFIVARGGKDKVLGKTAAAFNGKPVVWLSINSNHFANDKKAELAKWTKDVGQSYPMLLDADGKTGRMYGAKTTPHMFVIDQAGTLAYHGALDDDKAGTNANAKNFVKEAVDALLNQSAVAITTKEPYGCSVKYKN